MAKGSKFQEKFKTTKKIVEFGELIQKEMPGGH